MSKEIINKIKEVEAEATQIKNAARDEARARVLKAEAEGKKLYESSVRQAHELNAKRLELTREKADELMQSIRDEALAEAATMRDDAQFNMREAIRFIILGVNEQCQ